MGFACSLFYGPMIICKSTSVTAFFISAQRSKCRRNLSRTRICQRSSEIFSLNVPIRISACHSNHFSKEREFLTYSKAKVVAIITCYYNFSREPYFMREFCCGSIFWTSNKRALIIAKKRNAFYDFVVIRFSFQKSMTTMRLSSLSSNGFILT